MQHILPPLSQLEFRDVVGWRAGLAPSFRLADHIDPKSFNREFRRKQ
jgi:hypothetical protein